MNGIPRRLLGRTGLEVSTLGYGAMELALPPGGGRSDGDDERLLNTVIDSGINFIDTSIDYGQSEERIGRFISYRRSEYFLASKCGCVPGSPDHFHDERPPNVRAGVEHSLRRLRTDYLDVVQLHRSLSRWEIEVSGALDELSKLKQEGKVRWIGSSGVMPTIVEQIQMGVFDVLQIPYSVLQREHEALIYLASGLGAGIVIRGGVARGMPMDWEHRDYYMLPAPTARAYWERARLDDLLDGMSRQEFVLRFTLSNPDLDTTIVGTRSLEHLQENIAAAEKGPLPADLVSEAKSRMAALTRSGGCSP
jgi:aryl-alcohol dehydrogenase-like predicted oxidoreductase